MLAAAESTEGDLALLVTSDEEAGQSRCIERFLAQERQYDAVVVAEPTQCLAVSAHRGIGTATVDFRGTAGHACTADGREVSAIHRAIGWASTALEEAKEKAYQSSSVPELTGIRMNIGTISGGVKANVIAAEASLRVGLRPPPGQDPRNVSPTWSRLK